MKRRRGKAFWMALAAFAAAALGWLCMVPRDADRLYRAIPANATYVGIHDDLASRWSDVAGSPITLSLLSSIGIPPDDLRRRIADPKTRQWVRRLASDRMVIAQVPSLGDTGVPAWVCASWIGGRSQRLRWALAWRRVAGLRRVGREGAVSIWACRLPRTPQGLFASLALTEGMFLGCLSTDPAGVRYLVAAVDGSPFAPSLASENRLEAMARRGLPTAAPDRGWFRVAGGAPAATETGMLIFALTSHTTQGVEGRAIWTPSRHTAAPDLDPGLVASLQPLLGDVPQFVGVVPSVYVGAIQSQSNFPCWMREAAGAVSRRASAPAVLALLGGEYSGRIRGLFGGDTNGPVRGLKVPTVLMGVWMGEGGEPIEAAVSEALDRVNAACRGGLIPHRVMAAGQGVTVFEETRDTLYGRLALDERAASTVYKGWLILCSNLGVLSRLIERSAAASAAPEGETTPWWQLLNGSRSTAFGWVDLDSAGQTVKEGLAAWSLLLMSQEASGSAAQRQRLAVARAWADTFRPLGHGALFVRSSESGIELQFRMGSVPLRR